MRAHIIDKATDLFLNYGFKSVTMDDIANALGISKKTIYTHFKNKNELVKATTFHLFDVISEKIQEIIVKKENPIEEIYDIKHEVMNHLKNEKSSPQYQLQKYYPETFVELKEKQFEMMHTCVTDNLERGINLGIYRNNLNVEFLSKLYFNSLLNIRNSDIFPLKENTLFDLIEQFYEYHLRGICTEKGLVVLNQFINNTLSTNNE